MCKRLLEDNILRMLVLFDFRLSYRFVGSQLTQSAPTLTPVVSSAILIFCNLGN